MIRDENVNIFGDTSFQSLKKYGYDFFVKPAAKSGRVIGRDADIWNVLAVLYRQSKNNPLLIGEHGVGKKSIVKGLAQKIVRCRDVSDSVKGVRIIFLDTRALVSGREFVGRMKMVLKEIEETGQKVILFIDEIHLVVEAGGSYFLDILLGSARLWCIGATTPGEFKKYVKDAAFERWFQHVLVAESNVVDTVDILRGLKKSYEEHHGFQIFDSALVTAAEISSRYIAGYLPDKAIDLLDKACVKLNEQLYCQPEEVVNLESKIMLLKYEFHSLENENNKASKSRLAEIRKELSDLRDKLESLKIKYKKENYEEVMVVLQETDIARAAGLKFWTLEGVEANIANIEGTNEKKRQTELAKRLHERVVGQDEAVKAVSEAVTRYRAGFGVARKPIGSFLFLGPTSVGSNLAKALVEHMFDDEKLLIRMDMSMYTESHSVCRYVGEIIEAVRTSPYSVMLLDEVEKAHQSVLNTLLQMLDGELKDRDGHTLDFTNIVIIMTSNLGAAYLLMDNARFMVMDEVRRHFKARLLDTLDEIVILNPHPLPVDQSR